MRGQSKITDILACVIIIAVLLWTVLPLYWLVITAFKPLEEFMAYPPTFWPSQWTLDNFVEGLVRQHGAPAIWDSAVIAVGTFMLSMAVGVPAAYSIARFKTGGPDLSFTILSMRFMPPIVPTVAFFLIAARLHILDTYMLLILVNSMANIPFVVWIMKGFYDTVPWEIEMAGIQDGATRFQVWTKLVLPQVKPAIMALGIFSFLAGWSEFILPLVLAPDNKVQVLSVYLAALIADDNNFDMALFKSVGVFYVLPVIVLFVFFQNKLMNIYSGGTKG